MTVLEAFKAKGYPLYTDGRIQFYGIRANERIADTFNDILGMIRFIGGKHVTEERVATVDPGVSMRVAPVNGAGAAIVKPGYYKSVWERGLHKGKRQAFVQRGSITVYRDNDKDAELDTNGKTQTGLFGINLHDAYSANVATRVGSWSAGCQVLQKSSDLARWVALADAQIKRGGIKTFDYALFDAKDIA